MMMNHGHWPPLALAIDLLLRTSAPYSLPREPVASYCINMMLVQIVVLIISALCLRIDHAESFALAPPPSCRTTRTTNTRSSSRRNDDRPEVVLAIESSSWSTKRSTSTAIVTRFRRHIGGSRCSQFLLSAKNNNRINDDENDNNNDANIDKNNNLSNNNNKEDKFSFYQRIESTKTGLIGLLSGGILSTPFIALHDIPTYGLASWEFDTDMGSLQSALFAIVYRYCIRANDNNSMLNMGVIGAFIFVRTISRIRVPSYCTAAPLDCGDPFGYFDYDMIGQLIYNGLESVALFGGAAFAMELAYRLGWVTKFPS